MSGPDSLELLRSPIRRYAWGSRTALAALQGRPAPTAAPEAELWLGAHPGAPSTVPRPGSGRSAWRDAIADGPDGRSSGAEVGWRGSAPACRSC